MPGVAGDRPQGDGLRGDPDLAGELVDRETQAVHERADPHEVPRGRLLDRLRLLVDRHLLDRHRLALLGSVPDGGRAFAEVHEAGARALHAAPSATGRPARARSSRSAQGRASSRRGA